MEEEKMEQEAAPQQPPAKSAPQAQDGQADPRAKRAGEVAQRFLTAAMKLLYSSKETADGIVQMVAQAGSPEDGIAHAAMAILGRVREQVKGMNPDLVFGIAPMVVAMIAELVVVAKVAPPSRELLDGALAKLKPLIAQSAQGGQKPSAAQPQAQPETGIVSQAMGA